MDNVNHPAHYAGTNIETIDGAFILPQPAELEGADVPPVKEYLKSAQKNGKELLAEEVFNETWLWLKKFGCEGLVNTQLINQYAMAVARQIQCEEAISEYGFLAKHPTTGNAISSPYVSMLVQFTRQANQAWTSTLEYVRESKLKELSAACNTAIENGVDVTLSDGETHHFSLTAQDQLNLISFTSLLSAGQTGIPYHADGERCKFYSIEDITVVIKAAREFITYHTAYYNSLKAYVLSITDVKTLAGTEYGAEIPEEYQSEVLSEI